MWFFTEAQPDLYLPEIYDNVVTSARVYTSDQLIHKCRNSCFKYCKTGEIKKCRYEFVQVQRDGNAYHAVVVEDRDRRNRVRVKVRPPRNNGNLNPVCKHPAL